MRTKLVVIFAALVVSLLAGGAALAYAMSNTTRERSELREFRQIRVGMELQDVKRLFPDQEPVSPFALIEIDEAARPTWNWLFDGVIIAVEVDQSKRVTSATYQYKVASNHWLNIGAGWVGISRQWQWHLIKVP